MRSHSNQEHIKVPKLPFKLGFESLVIAVRQQKELDKTTGTEETKLISGIASHRKSKRTFKIIRLSKVARNKMADKNSFCYWIM